MKGNQQAPVINLNGTSAEELIKQMVEAHRAVLAAYEAVQRAAPHGRDYQTCPSGLEFGLAQQQHSWRLQRLHEISQELGEIGEKVATQHWERMK